MTSEVRDAAGGSAAREEARQLLSVSAEASLFWRLRYRVVRSLLRTALRESRFQVLSVALAMLLLWAGLLVLFLEGFSFIRSGLVHPGMRAQMTHAVFNIFFLALTVMLFFSAAIVLYGGLYRSEEVVYLLATPARSERIVWHKFQETAFFSCWGFLLLASPMLLAYGIVAGAPWYYYAVLLPFIVAFVLIPAGLGGLACLVAVRIVPAIRVHIFVALAVVVLAAGVFFGWRVLAYRNRDMMTLTWFQDVVARLEYSEQRLLPSWWLSSGLLEAAHPVAEPGSRPAWLESLLFLAVLTSNAMLLHVLLGRTAARVLRPSYSGLQGLGRTRRRGAGRWLDRSAEWVCALMPAVMRHLLIKDLRLFRRDPVQWSQCAIFFGLLLFYFLNVRRFNYDAVVERWVVLVSFFNLAVVALLLSTFTTRFIFPLISLEGRRFWVLGTAPISRGTILWSKFWFACGGAVPSCGALVLISDVTLRIPQQSLTVVWIHQLACFILCVGLSALAVGLGARLPSLRETSPSRIAAGFGGTLNLVLSSLFIIAVMLLTAVPCFFWAQKGGPGPLPESPFFGGWIGLGSAGSVAVGVALCLALGVVTTVVPLRLGLRAFSRLEF